MQTVTFAKPYRHRLSDLKEARYPVGEMTVSEEVAKAARKSGALQEEENGRGSSEANGAGGNDQSQE